MSSDDTRTATQLFTGAVAESLDTRACEEKVRGLHERLGAILGAVEDLRPPDDAEAAQADFLAAANESLRLVGEAAEDVGDGDLACGQPLNRRIYGLPSTMRAEKAISRLEQLGYRIFGD